MSGCATANSRTGRCNDTEHCKSQTWGAASSTGVCIEGLAKHYSEAIQRRHDVVSIRARCGLRAQEKSRVASPQCYPSGRSLRSMLSGITVAVRIYLNVIVVREGHGQVAVVIWARW